MGRTCIFLFFPGVRASAVVVVVEVEMKENDNVFR